MLVYIDESGDLGWKFNLPYPHGGSSRYLTICSLLIPNELQHIPERIIRKLYKKGNHLPSDELKGFHLTSAEINFFVHKTIDLLQKYPEITITAITVKKENVQSHIRQDANKIYNYMISLSLLDEICSENVVKIIPDPRSIKVKSGNSLVDYLQIQLWFEKGCKTSLRQGYQTSDKCLNLQFIDMITHIVWDFYEHHNNSYFKYLVKQNNFKHKDLFF